MIEESTDGEDLQDLGNNNILQRDATVTNDCNAQSGQDPNRLFVSNTPVSSLLSVTCFCTVSDWTDTLPWFQGLMFFLQITATQTGYWTFLCQRANFKFMFENCSFMLMAGVKYGKARCVCCYFPVQVKQAVKSEHRLAISPPPRINILQCHVELGHKSCDVIFVPTSCVILYFDGTQVQGKLTSHHFLNACWLPWCKHTCWWSFLLFAV